MVFNLRDISFHYFIYQFIKITRSNCIKTKKRRPWYVLKSSVFKSLKLKNKFLLVSTLNYAFMFKDFQLTFSVYLWIHFLGKYKSALKCYTGIESNCNPWFTGTQHLLSIAGQWRCTDGLIGCKNFTRTSFPSTETSSLIITPFFFIQATDVTAHPNINGNFISFPWMETGCKFGYKFEIDKLYSNAITQQNEKEPGIVWIQERSWW